jgi:hypothetical protein
MLMGWGLGAGWFIGLPCSVVWILDASDPRPGLPRNDRSDTPSAGQRLNAAASSSRQPAPKPGQ